MRLAHDRIDDELADFHVAFTTTEIVRVEVLRDLCDQIHVGKMVIDETDGARERLESNA